MKDYSDNLVVIGLVVILSIIIVPWAIGVKEIVEYLTTHQIVAI